MSVERTVSRRQILKGTAIAGAAGIVGPFFPGRVLGANDRVVVAIVGIRGQGQAHIKEFGKMSNVRVKTLCDLDQNLHAQNVAAFEKNYKYAPGTASDIKAVLDDKEIDAVSCAIPNHWHALAAVWACQAKKPVYIEKPACYGIWEGKQMVNAARKYGNLVQVGFQNRSRKNTMAAMKFLHDGKLGKVYMARGLCIKPRYNIGHYPDGPQTEGGKPTVIMGKPAPTLYTASYLSKVNYDMWQGPAPKRPFNPNRFHYNWHWFWDTGNGDTGNQGPHQFDVARWGLNKDEAPVRVRSFGGLYAYSDCDQETPNTQTSTFEYADGTVFEFATRGLASNGEGALAAEKAGGKGGVKIGVIFYGSEGRLEIDAEGRWETFLGPNDEPGPNSKNIVEEKSDAMNTVGSGMSGHFVNFIDAVKAKNQEKLNCEIEVGYKSSILPHMGNISYRLKRELKWDGKKEQFVGDSEANGMLKRKESRKGYDVPKIA
jgi:predicted dehydrogenase